MKKRMFWLGLMFMVVGLCSSGVFAASMGAPVAGLETGKWSVGLDYAYTDMTVAIKADYIESVDIFSPPPADNQTIEQIEGTDDFESNMIFVNFSCGITDKLEVFLRLGFSDVDVPITDGEWDPAAILPMVLAPKRLFTKWVTLSWVDWRK